MFVLAVVLDVIVEGYEAGNPVRALSPTEPIPQHRVRPPWLAAGLAGIVRSSPAQ